MTVEYVNSEKKMKNKTQKTEIKATREKAICQIKKKKKLTLHSENYKKYYTLATGTWGQAPLSQRGRLWPIRFHLFPKFLQILYTTPSPTNSNRTLHKHTHSHWNTLTHTVESFDVETKRIVGLATGGGGDGVGNVTAVLRVSRSPNLGQFTRFGPKWQNACETYVVVVAYSVRFPTSSKNLNGKQKVLNLKRKTRNIREKEKTDDCYPI